MSKIITKILTCLYGTDNDDAVLEGAINFSHAFNAQLVVATTEEGRRNSAESINNRLSSEPVNVEKVTLANEAYKTAAKIAVELGADLVVVSFSKQTQKLVNALDIPVLSILEGFKKERIKNIVMPIHDNTGTRQKIPIATSIAKVFNANIHIAVVTSSSKEEQARLKTYAYQAEKYIKEKGSGKSTYQIEIEKDVVPKTIKIAKDSNADLIIIMNDRDGGGWFGKSDSEQIMAGSGVPVLVVEPKDTTISHAGY